LELPSLVQDYDTIIQTSCHSFTFNGNTYTSDTTIIDDTLSNTMGCDSVIFLNIKILSADTAVVAQGLTLTAKASNATYQWIDCGTNTRIPNALNATFDVVQSGDYAVEVTQNGCVDTSSCFTYINVWVNEIEGNENVRVYPNPTSHTLNIETQNFKITKIQIRDNSGKIVKTITSNFELVNVKNLPIGVYHIELIGENQTVNKRFIKQ